MKKLLLLLILPFLVYSCDLLIEEEENPYAAPSMGSASDIPASNATNYPATDSEALLLYTETYELFSDLLEFDDENSSITTTLNPRDLISSRATQAMDETISLNENGVVITGTLKGEMFVHDDLVSSPYPHGSYAPGMKTSIESDLIINLNASNISDGDYTYTVVGEGIEKNKSKQEVDITISNAGMAYDRLKVEYKNTFGYAMSVRRSDGLGAKYIISVAIDFSKTYNSYNEYTTNYTADMREALNNSDYTFEVYDDNNNLIADITLN